MDEDFEMEEMEEMETVTLTDEAGRTIDCTLEHEIEVEGKTFVLLLPVHAPVEIVAWQGDDAEEEALPVEDPEQLDRLFPLAKAVLEELNLILKRTAVTLTVEGDLPELDEDGEFSDADANGNGMGEEEELQFLATFYCEEQEFGIYAPLDPFLILARLDENDQPHLLSEEELQQIEPMLPMIEDQLMEQFE